MATWRARRALEPSVHPWQQVGGRKVDGARSYWRRTESSYAKGDAREAPILAKLGRADSLASSCGLFSENEVRRRGDWPAIYPAPGAEAAAGTPVSSRCRVARRGARRRAGSLGRGDPPRPWRSSSRPDALLRGRQGGRCAGQLQGALEADRAGRVRAKSGNCRARSGGAEFRKAPDCPRPPQYYEIGPPAEGV